MSEVALRAAQAKFLTPIFQYFSSLGSVIACQHFHSVAFPDVQFLLLV
jgi:hypothetical protein